MEDKLTTQEWLPIEKIFENGIIKVKDKKYVKIMKINPINIENIQKNLKEENKSY